MIADILDVSKISPFALSDTDVVEGESNTSIVAKTAWKYRVKPASLVRFLLQNSRNISVVLGSDMAVSANSVTNKTVGVNRRLRFMTGLPNLNGSYIYLRSFLDHGARGLISPYKKWCGQCYAESIENNTIASNARVSDQLYWSLSFAQHCAKHLCVLSERCGKCYQRQPYISSVVEPGYCNYCYFPLSEAPSLIVEDDEQSSDVEALLLKYDIFYPQITQPSESWTLSTLAKNLRFVIGLSGGDCMGEIAFRCGISKLTLRDWCACRHGVSLQSLMSMVEGFALSKASDLFSSPDCFNALLEKQFNGCLNFRAKKSRGSLLPDISAFFQRIIAGEEKAMSQSAIAKQFGVSTGMLQYAFKMEVEQVSKLYKEQKAAESLKAKDRLQFEMNKAVRRCGAKGRRMDWAHILAELKGVDLRFVKQEKLDQARSKAVKLYLKSNKRDRTRNVEKLVCDS